MQRFYQKGGGYTARQFCRLCCATNNGSSFTQTQQKLELQLLKKCIYPSLACKRQPLRMFSTSQCLLAEKTSHHFDDYYTAVVEATETNKRFQMLREKYRIVEDPDDQERAMQRWKFIEAVDFYIEQSDNTRRKHTEFIYDAMKQMKKYGVHRDLTCYKALIKVLVIP